MKTFAVWMLCSTVALAGPLACASTQNPPPSAVGGGPPVVSASPGDDPRSQNSVGSGMTGGGGMQGSSGSGSGWAGQ